MGLFDKFSGLFEQSDTMSFYTLGQKLVSWKKSGGFPMEYELPQSILIDPKITSKLIKLYKLTRSDEFERAISLYWADGEYVISDENRGNRESITPNSRIEVKYVPMSKVGYYKREIYLNGKKYSSKELYHTKVPKVIEVHYLFNFHTHPPHFDSTGAARYSFFSAQDIKSLVKSGSVLSGMVGDKVWLIMRTAQTPTAIEHLTDYQINMEFLIKELHIAVYTGEFKKRVERVVIDPA